MAKVHPPATLTLAKGEMLYGLAQIDRVTGTTVLDQRYDALTTELQFSTDALPSSKLAAPEVVRFRATRALTFVALQGYDSMRAWQDGLGVDFRKADARAKLREIATAQGFDGYARIEARKGWTAFWVCDIGAFTPEATLQADGIWLALDDQAAVPGAR